MQSNPQASHLGPIRSQWHAVKGNIICQLHLLIIAKNNASASDSKEKDLHAYFLQYISCHKIIRVKDRKPKKKNH